MKKRLLLVGLIVSLLTPTLITQTYATTISGSASCPWVLPNTTLQVSVDISRGKLTFHYWGNWLIYVPLPSGFTAVLYYHAWDDKGFDEQEVFLRDREDTITLNYNNRDTWLHVAVGWQYVGAFWILNPSCRVDLYIPNGDGDTGWRI